MAERVPDLIRVTLDPRHREQAYGGNRQDAVQSACCCGPAEHEPVRGVRQRADFRGKRDDAPPHRLSGHEGEADAESKIRSMVERLAGGCRGAAGRLYDFSSLF